MLPPMLGGDDCDTHVSSKTREAPPDLLELSQRQLCGCSVDVSECCRNVPLLQFSLFLIHHGMMQQEAAGGWRILKEAKKIQGRWSILKKAEGSQRKLKETEGWWKKLNEGNQRTLKGAEGSSWTVVGWQPFHHHQSDCLESPELLEAVWNQRKLTDTEGSWSKPKDGKGSWRKLKKLKKAKGKWKNLKESEGTWRNLKEAEGQELDDNHFIGPLESDCLESPELLATTKAKHWKHYERQACRSKPLMWVFHTNMCYSIASGFFQPFSR